MPDLTNLSEPLLGRVGDLADRFADQQRATEAVEQILAKIGVQLEDLIDIVEAQASLAEPGESIPYYLPGAR